MSDPGAPVDERASGPSTPSVTVTVPPDEYASSEITLRTLRPHLVRFAVFGAVQVMLALVATSLLSLSAQSISAASILNADQGFSLLTTLAKLVTVLSLIWTLGWLASLFSPVREPIAEGNSFHPGQAPHAAATHAWIAQLARARNAPFRIDDASADGRPLLALQNGTDRGTVLVTTYGNDLYVGWTMWRRRSTAQVVAQVLKDVTGAFGGMSYTPDLRLAGTRAFRDLIMAAAAEGVRTATSGPAAPAVAAPVVAAPVVAAPAVTAPAPSGGISTGPGSPYPGAPGYQTPYPATPYPSAPGYPAVTPYPSASPYPPMAQPGGTDDAATARYGGLPTSAGDPLQATEPAYGTRPTQAQEPLYGEPPYGEPGQAPKAPFAPPPAYDPDRPHG